MTKYHCTLLNNAIKKNPKCLFDSLWVINLQILLAITPRAINKQMNKSVTFLATRPAVFNAEAVTSANTWPDVTPPCASGFGWRRWRPPQVCLPDVCKWNGSIRFSVKDPGRNERKAGGLIMCRDNYNNNNNNKKRRVLFRWVRARARGVWRCVYVVWGLLGRVR